MHVRRACVRTPDARLLQAWCRCDVGGAEATVPLQLQAQNGDMHTNDHASLSHVLELCGAQVFQRGWLSSNNVLFASDPAPLLIDSGYCSHATQTLTLVRDALRGKALARLLNTHLHSDHCGGNAALQSAYPEMHTAIPAGEAQAVARWDDAALSFDATGQECPRFAHNAELRAGDQFIVHDLVWEVHSAPGHDPHSVVFFQPQHRVLVSADALWENGFGVVFPELDGVRAFDAVGDTLNLIEALDPAWVIPGHGSPFGEVPCAIERARRRLQKFVSQPEQHERHALKVLLKFKLLDWRSIEWLQLLNWCQQTPYLHTRLSAAEKRGETAEQWLSGLIDELCRSGAARFEQGVLSDQ